jgi:TatD DNase family protein
MQLIDTHVHLTDPKLPMMVAEAVERAKNVGVGQMVCPSVDLETSQQAVKLAQQFPNQVFAAVGVHPHYAGASFSEFEILAKDPGVVAIGEVGLDYHRLSREQVGVPQREMFVRFLDLAQRSNLPVIIHGRQAYDDILAVMKDFSSVPVVLHSFEADAEIARQALDRGWLISLTALITYPEYGWLREVVAQLPLDRLMVETDAPYLPPAAIDATERPRGLINEPANVVAIAERLSIIKDMSLNEVAEATTKTAREFFHLPELA